MRGRLGYAVGEICGRLESRSAKVEDEDYQQSRRVVLRDGLWNIYPTADTNVEK